MNRSDLLGIVEAGYRLAGTDEEWLQGIADAALPVLNRGRGIVAARFSREERDFSLPPACAGLADGVREVLIPALSAVPTDRRARGLAPAPCTTMSEATGEGQRFREDAAARQFLHPFGILDVMWIAAHDPRGMCCTLGIGLPDIATPSVQEKRMYSRLGAHLTTALRLRHRLANRPGDDGDVRLRADGKVDSIGDSDTTGAALAALRAAAVTLDRAKGSMRTNPDEALAAWTSLVSARWSLVDQFDDGGRRYIIAHPNEPKTEGLPGLSERERLVVQYAALGHPNKLIAYELGLAVSSVGTFLKRALKKLGLKTRLELIASVR